VNLPLYLAAVIIIIIIIIIIETFVTRLLQLKTNTSATYATLKYIKIYKKIRTTVAGPNEHYVLE